MQIQQTPDLDPSLLAIEMQRIANKSLPEIATELFFLNQKVENLENAVSKICQIKEETEYAR